MGTVPNKIADKIGWYSARESAWTTSSAAIGLATGDMTTMSGLISTASTALDAQTAAKTALKNSTIALNAAVSAMGDLGSALIKKIRAKAEMVGGDSVYVLASVPPPATPTPVGPPGQPTDLVVKLTQTGALDMSWKCPNPAGANGTTYNVFRRIGDVGEYTYVGGTGVRQFTDESCPGGSPSVMYKIQAVRSTQVGPWATFNVFLGVSSGGTAIVQSVVNTTPKIAA